MRIVYYYYIFIYVLDAMEELCFGEDFAELTSLRHLFINVTRSGLGCNRAGFAISVSYNKSVMESVGKPCNHRIILLWKHSSNYAVLFLQSVLPAVSSCLCNCKQIAPSI